MEGDEEEEELAENQYYEDVNCDKNLDQLKEEQAETRPPDGPDKV